MRPAFLTPGVPSFALAALLVGGSGVLFQAERSADQDSRSDAFGREAATVEIALDRSLAAIDGSLHGLAALTAGATSGDGAAIPFLSADGIRAAATAVPGTDAPVVRSNFGTPADAAAIETALAAPGTRVALELARDTGMVAATDVTAAQPDTALVVLARYAGKPPATTVARRTQLAGWTVGLVRPSAVVSASLAGRGTTDLRLRVGDGVAYQRGTSDDATTIEADLAGSQWVLELAPVTPLGHVSLHTWVAVFIGLLLALLSAGAGFGTRRRYLKSELGRRRLAREARAVSDVGLMLQQSLDIAEMIPTMALRLAEDFGLDRLGIAVIGEDGTLNEVFTYGARTTLKITTPAALPPVPESVPPAIEVALPLVRAGRSVGVLRLSASRGLSPSQLASIRSAADLVGAATYNAELYVREQATVRRLQEVDKLKDAFLGTISHELRTPITAIRGFTTLLAERWGTLADTDRREFVRRINRNAASLGQLVDDLLDFARLERQALNVAPAPVAFSALVSSIVDQLSPLLAHHHVVQRIEPGVTAYVDPQALERILANLLSNAAKFSPEQTEISVEVSRNHATAVLAVADSGPGVSAEDRPRIFTRFYRGDGDAARSTRGAGIGLAVVRELVDQMGGEIQVEDRVPNGTRMVVHLPTAPPVVIVPEPTTAMDDATTANGVKPSRSTP